MINKEDISDRVAAKLKIGKGETKDIVSGAIDEIAAALKAGEEVRLTGLGTFSVKATAAREGRNPATGETVQIAAGKKVAYKVAGDLKRSL